MSILKLLQGLASAKPVPNSSEINELLNQQTDDVKQAVLHNNNQVFKNLISANRSYANEVRVTLY